MTATRPPAFDDRFSTPIEASRRGAHRARPRPASATLPVLAGVAVILIVAVVGFGLVRGDSGDDSKGNQLAASAGDDPTPSVKAPANAAAAAKPTTEAPAAGATAGDESDSDDTDTDTDTGKADETDEVDRSIKLRVLNSTSVKGLAKRVETDIAGDDWTVSGTGNSRNKNLPVTKIYYGRDSVKPTAVALQKDLGFGTVVKDASVITDGISVVLGADAS